MQFQRQIVETVANALRRDSGLIQILVGPRQVGKSTAAGQIEDILAMPTHSVSADSPVPLPASWIDVQWELAIQKAGNGKVLLIIDEIQKIPGWSETIKLLWDKQKRNHSSQVMLLLLDSSALLLQHSI